MTSTRKDCPSTISPSKSANGMGDTATADIDDAAPAIENYAFKTGIVQVAAGFVGVHQRQKPETGHRPHHADLRQAVVIPAAGRAAIGPAHILPVGDGAEQHIAVVENFAVHLHMAPGTHIENQRLATPVG